MEPTKKNASTKRTREQFESDKELDQATSELIQKRQKLKQAQKEYMQAVARFEAHPSIQHQRDEKRAEAKSMDKDALHHQINVWQRLFLKDIDPDVCTWLDKHARDILACPIKFTAGGYNSGRGQGPESWGMYATCNNTHGDEVCVQRWISSCEIFRCKNLTSACLSRAVDAQNEPNQAKWKTVIEGVAQDEIESVAVFLIVYSSMLPEFQ